MKIIEPKVELWQQGDDAKAHVARCARVCYGRETGNDKFTERYPEQSARLREETGGYFTLDDLDCIKVKFEIEKPVGDLANKINFDLLNTFFNHQHEMTRSSSVNKTTMKNILNDGRDISIAKLVENTSLIIK